jgi:YfiH family protein
VIKHHFFGKELVLDKSSINSSALREILENKGFSSSFNPILVNQIHGDCILTITNESQIPHSNKLPEFDAIITNVRDINICIITADCAPILIFDEEKYVIAVVHSGWKGSFNDIGGKTVDAMIDLGAELENIKIIFGPMIRQKSYEVDEDFYDQFIKQKAENKKFFILSNNHNHYLFDLASYTKEKLVRKGIKNIEDAEIDTYVDECFSSHRRSTHLGTQASTMRNVLVACIN